MLAVKMVFGYKALLSSFVNTARVVKRELRQREKDRAILARNDAVINSLLQKSQPICLELGPSSRRMEGWTGVDLNDECDIHHDLLNPLPFPDDRVAEIYSPHVLEHFHYPDIAKLLAECNRILKPGGVFKVAVPDSRIYLKAYFNPKSFDAHCYCRYKPGFQYNSAIDYVNYMAYMGGHHHYTFDEENLIVILSNAGFKSVRPRQYDADLDLEERRYQTIYAEAIK